MRQLWWHCVFNTFIGKNVMHVISKGGERGKRRRMVCVCVRYGENIRGKCHPLSFMDFRIRWCAFTFGLGVPLIQFWFGLVRFGLLFCYCWTSIQHRQVNAWCGFMILDILKLCYDFCSLPYNLSFEMLSALPWHSMRKVFDLLAFTLSIKCFRNVVNNIRT